MKIHEWYVPLVYSMVTGTCQFSNCCVANVAFIIDRLVNTVYCFHCKKNNSLRSVLDVLRSMAHEYVFPSYVIPVKNMLTNQIVENIPHERHVPTHLTYSSGCLWPNDARSQGTDLVFHTLKLELCHTLKFWDWIEFLGHWWYNCQHITFLPEWWTIQADLFKTQYIYIRCT